MLQTMWTLVCLFLQPSPRIPIKRQPGGFPIQSAFKCTFSRLPQSGLSKQSCSFCPLTEKKHPLATCIQKKNKEEISVNAVNELNIQIPWNVSLLFPHLSISIWQSKCFGPSFYLVPIHSSGPQNAPCCEKPSHGPFDRSDQQLKLKHVLGC